MNKALSFFIYSSLVILLSTQVNAQKIKVFILAGQSNMVGHGDIEPESNSGTLANFVENDLSGEFNYAQDQDGNWTTRDDVWIRFDHQNGDLLTDNWGVGYGGYEGQIGPEFGFGQLLGEYSEDQVLIIKTAWGGKSLAVDFRPPNAGGTVGPFYTQMISDIMATITNIGEEFPAYNGEEIEIAGFCWFQGWNDGEEDSYLNEYEENLKNLISDLRTDLSSPDLPFIVGLTGNGGYDLLMGDTWVQGLQTVLVPAQISAVESPEHSNVRYADTRSFWPEPELSPSPGSIHHWCNNAESYLRIGHELGTEMIKLLDLMSSSSQEESIVQNISLFPSPTIDHFQLKGISELVTVNILNINGQILESHEKISDLDQVHISELPKGIYFIEVLNEERHRISLLEMIKE